jgi:hypothetical protein
MVNRSEMNIDVREYLRVNPISVHETTLSGDGKDCFLYFDNNDYAAYTQNQIFRNICENIFGSLVKWEDEKKHYVLNCDVDDDGVVTWNSDAAGIVNVSGFLTKETFDHDKNDL